MGWRNTKQFNPSKMGTRRGWCLQNCRLGYGIEKGTYPSAKADMEAQRRNGTLHPMSEIPHNCAVPVYLDTASKYEHVVVDDKGLIWSDGKRLSSLDGFKIFGWGEFCDGVRVVEYVKDPTPTPTPTGFLPPRGYWKKGDTDKRIGELDAFYYRNYWGYFCRSKAAAKSLLAGNYFGTNTERWTKEFQRRTGLVADGCVGPITYAKLKVYGFWG